MRKIIYSIMVIFILSNVSVAAASEFNKVLYIGDSHSYGSFGKSVDQYLRSISDSVTSIASCGSSPSNWMSTEGHFKKTNCGFWRKSPNGNEVRVTQHEITPFPQEIKSIEPDLTVVALGTNILASPSNISKELKFMEQMLNSIDKVPSKCIWVGPPDARKQPFKKNLASGIQQMKALAEKHSCAFIDSSKYTQYPSQGSDGIHYGAKQAIQWGSKVADEMKQKVAELKNKSKATYTKENDSQELPRNSEGVR